MHNGDERSGLGVEAFAQASEKFDRAVVIEDELPAAVGEGDVNGRFRFTLPAGRGLGRRNLFQEPVNAGAMNQFGASLASRE
jgi:hypothetical protein